jgi:hypothetical protein
LLLYAKANLVEEHSFKHYVYTVGEIHRLLEAEGFKILSMYNSPEKIHYIIGDAQVYLVAEKVGSNNAN